MKPSNYDACRFCGDGDIDSADGETCDDANGVSGDGCSSTCEEECACGDGYINWGCGEVCDDHNTVDGDGCSASCQDECDGAIQIHLDDTWVQAGDTQTVTGTATNTHMAVSCDTFLTPGALGSLTIGDRSGTPSYIDVPANTSIPISFEIDADWDAPGYTYIPALGHAVDWLPFYVHTSPEGIPLPTQVFGGTACVLPAGEVTITYQWDPSYECAYDFRAKIPPLGASFQTREVDEFENAAETTDTCWYAGNPGGWFESTVPNNMGRGAEWVVQADNHWGPPSPTGGGPTPPNADAVGVYEDAARFYQQNGPNAGNCGVTFVQHMVMSCSRLGTFIEYTNHPIGWSVTGTSFTAFRDQQSVTKPFQ